MDKALHVLAALAGAYFLIFMGGSWVFTPEIGAQNLQMIYMEGAARNSQIGDLGALFFCAWAVLPVMAFGKSALIFLYASAFLIGITAVMQVLTGLVHDAPTIWPFVVIEIITVAIWAGHARKIGGS